MQQTWHDRLHLAVLTRIPDHVQLCILGLSSSEEILLCDVGLNYVELWWHCQSRQLPVVLTEGLDGRDIVTLKDITLCP